MLGRGGARHHADALTTAVTCPTVRTHPGIVAQAAATIATLMPGRFRLGVGSGEALDEHVFGDRWPEPTCAWRWPPILMREIVPRIEGSAAASE